MSTGSACTASWVGPVASQGMAAAQGEPSFSDATNRAAVHASLDVLLGLVRPEQFPLAFAGYVRADAFTFGGR